MVGFLYHLNSFLVLKFKLFWFMQLTAIMSVSERHSCRRFASPAQSLAKHLTWSTAVEMMMILVVNTAAVLHSILMIKPFKLLPTSKFLFVVYDLELDLELFLLSYLHSSPQALKNPLKRLAHVLCLAPSKWYGVDDWKAHLSNVWIT